MADLREYFEFHLKLAAGQIDLFDDQWDVITNLSDRNLSSRTPAFMTRQAEIESSIISLIGGLIGVVARVGGAMLLAKIAGWSTIVSPFAVVVALLTSACVGIFFGIYPAGKAAALHPIEALRYE